MAARAWLTNSSGSGILIVRLGGFARRSGWHAAKKLLVLLGVVLADHLRREALDQETLEAALREHGVPNVADVEMAVLGIDGSVSVVPTSAQTHHIRRPVKYLKLP